MSLDAILVRLRVPIGFAVGIAFLWLARPRLELLAVALPLVAVGEGLRLWASGHIEKNRQLATSGPYGHVRHPLYVGSGIILLGFAIGSGRLLLGAALIAMFLLLYVPVARREERVVAEKFGADHEVWRGAVPAALPRLRPYRGGGGGTFSWEAVRRHREHRTVLGQLLILLFLTWRSLAL